MQALYTKDDITDDKNTEVSAPKKPRIPPIKVLVRNTDLINTLILGKGIKDFLIKKISIGIKIVCEKIEIFNAIKAVLIENECQFFTHEQKNDKVFKAVIHGLDKKSADDVKNELVTLGYNCLDVKTVIREYDNGFIDTLYIVYFSNGSVRLNDLRTKCKSLFRTIIRWDYQRKLKDKPVQCRNCQMFGHGERWCNIKSTCGICAGKHRTTECQNLERVKCANCHGEHKSSDIVCPNRSAYMEIRDKVNKTHSRVPPKYTHKHGQTQFRYEASQFPPVGKNHSQPGHSSSLPPSQNV